MELTMSFMRAVQRVDINQLEEMLGDDFTLTTGRTGQEVRGRSEWLAVTRHLYRIEEFKFTDLKIQRYGDVAVVRSRYSQIAKMGPTRRNTTFLMTDVWVRHEHRWRLHLRHAQPISGD